MAGAERRLLESAVSQENKDRILAFRRQLVVEGLTTARIMTYLIYLKQAALIAGKHLVDCDKDDVIRIIAERERLPLSEWTKHTFKVVLKRFFKWLRNSDDYPPEVRWINANVRADRLCLPGDSDIFTPEEVQRLILAADHPRDRAFIATLYEGGCRIGEIATARIKDVLFEKQGCRINVIGKTGSRPVFVVNAAQSIAAWLSMHPKRQDRDAPLWVNIGQVNRGEQMAYGAIRKMMDMLFKKAGVKKRRNPHLFRHTRASHLASVLTEAQMNQHFGWIQGSRMPATYVHLNGRSTQDALLKMHGMASPAEESRPVLQPRTCPRCETVNPSDFAFCGKCGCGLDIKAVLEAQQKQDELDRRRSRSDGMLNVLMQDAEVRELLKRKLASIDVGTNV
ncbi:MAG: tyrosine-type recombinase/integrase [Planctomycetes bacterium]|nr:tyrosine-type recombinase/integrase [Planctomycetota bacterium]